MEGFKNTDLADKLKAAMGNNYGVDKAGNPVVINGEKRCKKCNDVTRIYLSDGSERVELCSCAKEVRVKLKEALESGQLPTNLMELGKAQAPAPTPHKRTPNMTRQQRREMERSAKKFTDRQTFTKSEVQAMNEASYAHGTAFALYAAAKVLGLGEVRLDRVRMEIADLELRYFKNITMDPLPFDIQEINRYKGATK